MRTTDLIEAIAADAATPPKRLTPAVWMALGVSAIGAAIVLAWLLGPRPDFGSAIWTSRFSWKFFLTAAFALAAGTLALRLARPGADPRAGRVALLVAFGLLAASVAAELVSVPPEAWGERLVGRNWLVCLVNVPMLSAIPLAALLLALRRGAPASPARLGAAAGLLAGAIGATFYAAHCPDDSPLFVAAWYGASVGLVTLAGAGIGARALDW